MTRPSWIKRCIAGGCCAYSIATASAATVTLTFDHIGDKGEFVLSYTESGFIITSLYPGEGHLHAGDGFLWLHNRGGSSPYQIRRVDGGNFDFLGFDYAGWDSTFVSDTGASFTILRDQPPATYTMPAAFQNVSYINWYVNEPDNPDSSQYQWGRIDNIVLNVASVPEPAQAAMLSLGLAGLLLRAHRSQRRGAEKETTA